VKVELSEAATSQVRSLDTWWRKHRPAAPELFLSELRYAMDLLEDMPTLGSPCRLGGKKMRRVLLRRSHCHLYVLTETSQVTIVAVWNAYRGQGPKL
jgi:plasmid stabilization system protein ParE